VTGTVPAGSQRAFAVFSSPRLIIFLYKTIRLPGENIQGSYFGKLCSNLSSLLSADLSNAGKSV
jgi:hypothetical protein